MGRKLDLSGLTDNEAEHVLQVVQRDMKLRKKEEKRLSELKQELDEEGSRCLLLSRQSCFNQRCCIRCCLPFTFLFNPKRQCLDCRYNICKACRVFNKQEKAWLCSSCQKSRLLKAQSLEWYYTNVKQRFKRFGSAKVLKTLYRKHLAEHGALSDLTEGSGYEESVYNEGSICGSDSNFFRQSEEHSMAETLSVALRVAEEAIDEAISKAEFHTDSQEKQNEAHYLQEHRGELIEELAQTIVQKIIKRRKTLADRKVKNNQDWPLEQKTDPLPHHHHPAAGDQASSCLKLQSGLWRSHSAFSLLDNDSLWTFEKEGVKSTISPWKSLDTLDSTVLQSPDGNWITLQSVQLSPPSLLNKRKSLVCTALEGESGVASYGTGSDDETKHEPHSSWGAALREIQKMTDSDLRDTRDRIQSPPTNGRGSRGDLPSDSDGQWKPHSPLHDLFKRKVPVGGRHPSASTGICITDMNFNVEAASQEEDDDKVICSRKKRKTKKEQIATFSVTDLKKNNWSQPPSEAVTPDALTCEASTPEQFDPESDLSGHGVNQMEEELVFKLQELSGQVSESTDKEGTVSSEDGQREERGQGSEETDGEDDLDDQEEEDLEIDEEMESRLYKLVAQSRLCYLSSTDDELDKVNQSRGELDEDVDEEVNEQEEKKEGLASKLCQLEKEVKATQFSSTEDELDRVGVEEKTTEEQEGEGSNEELAVKVCKLANQVNATQFSSTEDELDRVGRDEETVWTLKQAAHLRDLASLDSITQFSLTEDGLDKPEDTEGESDSSCETEDVWNRAEERRESFADLDVQMFDLQDEMEEQKSENTAAKAISENVLDNQIKTDDAHKVRTGIEDPQKRDYFEETAAIKETEEENARETQRRQELKLKSSGGKSENTEIIDLNKTRTEGGHQAEAVWVDEMEKEKIKERSDDQGDWEATANSEEEDTELDRIISSMLTMTLVDIQGETFQKTAAESGRTNLELEDVDGSVTTRRGSGFKDEVIDEQSINASKETGRENRLQRHDTDVRPESAGKGKFTGEETFRIKEREELTSRSKNEQQEKEKDLGRRNVAQQVSERSEVGDENQREGSGGMETERQMKTQEAAESKEMVEKCEEMAEKHAADADERSTSSLQEGFLSPEEIQHRYSAVSLRSITTEVLKVLNATEELLQGAGGGDDSRLCAISLSPNTDVKKLDEQFCRLEENVYVAAGAVYGLEAELRDLEECARRACTSTPDMELSFLEEQVASAAARVQQSELQICDISARIGALKNAGLVVDTQSHLTKTRAAPVVPVTLESTRQLRRRLPVPPANKDGET